VITCSRIGIEDRFIDRLCIVQGSTIDWKEQFEAMDLIYHDSTPTLV
jgi:hypothetical protein